MSNIIPADSPSIYDALRTLVSRDSLLALVRPDNPPSGIAGFLFDLVDEDGVDLSSDITDHYIEDNLPVQDHIALRPETITVTGSTAELVWLPPRATAHPAAVPNPLPDIPDYGQELSEDAERLQAEADAAQTANQDAAESAKSLYGYYDAWTPAGEGQTKQSRIFGYIYQLWKGRVLFTVETPWGVFTNMVIESVTARQAGNTRTVTSFMITFKRLRTTKSLTTRPGLLAGRAVAQRAAEAQNGTVGQVPATDLKQQQIEQRITLPRNSPFIPATP